MNILRFLSFSPMKVLKLVPVTILFVAGLFYFSSGLMTPAKAWLSVHLIDDAWGRTLNGESEPRPWPWMDSHPVAKLQVPRFAREHIVMSGVSGSVMAFAPGWHDGTEKPGEKGISLISGHKDTHFGYLKNLQNDDILRLQKQDGAWKTYKVETLQILEKPEISVSDSHDASVLVLSTCFPFGNWDVGGKMRFVVVAREVPEKAMNIATYN